MFGSAPALQYPMVKQQNQALFKSFNIIKGQCYLICQKLASVLVEIGTREEKKILQKKTIYKRIQNQTYFKYVSNYSGTSIKQTSI